MKPFFNFVTLFPPIIEKYLTTSVIGKAKDRGVFDFKTYSLMEFGLGKRKQVDDKAYGGSGGMVLMVEPLVCAVEAIEKEGNQKPFVICPSPSGKQFNQNKIEKLKQISLQKPIVFICGHYEGVDQRFIDHWVDLEISIGNYVVSSGELTSLVICDSVIRALGSIKEENLKEESFLLRDPKDKGQLVEYGQYTRPSDFRGLKVPEILLSGHHKKISSFRLSESKKRTHKKNTPDF